MRTRTATVAVSCAAVLLPVSSMGSAAGMEMSSWTEASRSVAGSPSHHPRAASVHGAADFRMTFAPDKDVRHFEFNARAKPYTRPKPGAPDGLPTDAVGTVKISHYVAGQKLTVRAEGVVDCLVTAPGTATLTAKIVRADGLVKDWVGQRLGFSVLDSGRRHDRVGLSWVVSNSDQNEDGEWTEGRVGTCMAPAPFAPVTKGNYTVRHAELAPPPAQQGR